MAYLLTWNGDQDNFSDEELEMLIRKTSGNHTCKYGWSAGSRVNPLPAGARVFLLRQGTDRGIFGSGRLDDGEIYYDSPQWPSAINVTFDKVVPIADRLPRDVLMKANPSGGWKQAQQSCWPLTPADEKLLEKLWATHLRNLEAQSPRKRTGKSPR
ncbi:hypothetical protein [Rhodococcus aetherivorans]